MASPTADRSEPGNALLSTGPRTAEGKARASRNARKHGLLSRGRWWPRPSAGRTSKRSGMRWRRTFSRWGRSCAWRLRRATHIEAELFAPVVSQDWEETEDGEDLREVKRMATSHLMRPRAVAWPIHSPGGWRLTSGCRVSQAVRRSMRPGPALAGVPFPSMKKKQRRPTYPTSSAPPGVRLHGLPRGQR